MNKDCMMYGKLFESMYNGTLVSNWEALITFQQMIIIADDSGVVDITPQALSARTGIPLTHIEAGIKVLESDDIYSRSPEQNGRRIERLDSHRPWGWLIINYLKYKHMSSYQDKKKNDRERIAAKRKEKSNKNNDVAKCRKVSQPVADVAHIDINKDIDIKNNSPSIDEQQFNIFWENYPRKVSKKAAKRSFLNLKKKDQDQAIKDCKHRYADTKKEYIPHPKTYINNELWNDEGEKNGGAYEEDYAV